MVHITHIMTQSNYVVDIKEVKLWISSNYTGGTGVMNHTKNKEHAFSQFVIKIWKLSSNSGNEDPFCFNFTSLKVKEYINTITQNYTFVTSMYILHNHLDKMLIQVFILLSGQSNYFYLHKLFSIGFRFQTFREIICLETSYHIIQILIVGQVRSYFIFYSI